MTAQKAVLEGQLLAMSVAGRRVAFAAADVVQVLPTLPLWRPPTAPPPLRGFTRSAAGVLPVLSSRWLLGLGEEHDPAVYAHIVRVDRVDGQDIGLLVDRADGFVTPASLEPLTADETLNGCATALFSYEGTIGWVIDPVRLVGVAGSVRLAALTAEERRRQAEWSIGT